MIIRPKFIFLLCIVITSIPMYSLWPMMWCHCTGCTESIKYCSVPDGICFVNRGENLTTYGCLTRDESYEICPLSPNLRSDKYASTIISPIDCCDNEIWCNTNLHTLRVTGNIKIETQYEYDNGDLTCYCDSCDGLKICRTTGVCYIRNGIASDLNTQYGCIDLESVQHNCPMLPNQRSKMTGIILSRTFCCNNSNWCNADTGILNSVKLSGELKFRSLRFERIGIVNSNFATATYLLKFSTAIHTRYIVRYDGLVTSNRTEVITNQGRFQFEPYINSLYRFKLTPIINGINLTLYSRKFYFARIYGFQSSWFPSDFNYPMYNYTVVVCGHCEVFYNNYRCQRCVDYAGLNPSWIEGNVLNQTFLNL